MTEVRRTVDLPFRAEDLFELVSDVRRYPQFVRWVKSLALKRESREGEVWNAEAEALVGFKGFTERFTTAIRARRPGDEALPGTVEVKLVRGPLKKLDNSWIITPSASGSRVEFRVDFTFRNFLLQALAEANLNLAVGRIMDSFVKEAERRYQKVRAEA
ncbi:MAG: type II toxin-antitoxin system RatA family toxin [Hyphomonadaceae bacterium]